MAWLMPLAIVFSADNGEYFCAHYSGRLIVVGPWATDAVASFKPEQIDEAVDHMLRLAGPGAIVDYRASQEGIGASLRATTQKKGKNRKASS